MIGDPGQHLSEPSLRIDAVELGRLNERQHDRCALTAAIGAGEQPRLSAKSNSAQLTLRRIVAQTDAAILEEAREDVDALEHGFGNAHADGQTFLDQRPASQSSSSAAGAQDQPER